MKQLFILTIFCLLVTALGLSQAQGTGIDSELKVAVTPTATPFPLASDSDQPLALSWAESGGASDGGDMGYDVAVLNDGSLIVTGSFQGTADFGGETLVCGGGSDMFLVKYNPDGSTAWAKRAGGNDWCIGNAVDAFPDGTCIVAGYFEATATFGPGETRTEDLTATEYYDIFIAKYNADGTLNWVEKAGGDSFEAPNDVDAIPGGGFFVTGYYQQDCTFDPDGTPVVLNSDGNKDIFLARYNSDGSLSFAVSAGDSGVDEARGVAGVLDGTSYITGYFSETVNFGNGVELTSAKYQDMFVVKYDSNGDPVWGSRAGGNYTVFGESVDVMEDGTAIVTGSFDSHATFGPAEENEVDLSGYDEEIFVAKYNPDGSLVWAKSAGGNADDKGVAIIALSNGGCMAAGHFGYDSYYERGFSATFGPGEANESVLSSQGRYDVFLAQYEPDGSLAWVMQGAGPGYDYGYGLDAVSEGTFGVAGWFTESLTLGLGQSGMTEIISSGYAEVYAAAFAPPSGDPTPTPGPTPAPEYVDDDFDNASLDTEVWEVTEGSDPSLSSSRVNMDNCTIWSKEAYNALPLWVEFQDVQYGSLTDDYDSVSMGLDAENGGSCSMSMSKMGSNYNEGFGFGMGSTQGYGVLNSYSTIPGDTFDLTYKVDHEEAQLFMRRSYETATSYVNVLDGPIKTYMSADSGASFSVGRVYVHSEPHTNPAYCLVEPGGYYAYTLGTTGVTVYMSNMSFEYGYIKVEKKTGTAEGFTLSGLPYYWEISGMDGPSFSCSIAFSYNPAELSGISEYALECFRSQDGGSTWETVPGEVDAQNHVYTTSAVTGFSTWTLGADVTAARNWTLYE